MKIAVQFLVLFLSLFFVVDALDAPYQASIWLRPGYGSVRAQHLCNGAIIDERVILTAASCMLLHMPQSVMPHPISPIQLAVVAGDLTFNYAKIIKTVVDIRFAPGFNNLTWENDLAALELNDSLPLTRSDIKWIILDDHDHLNHTCMANFYNSSATMHISGPTRPIFIMDNKICSNATKLSGYRTHDICSSYVMLPGVICNFTEADLNISPDRGTALVCDSKLFGILSKIIYPGANYSISCNQPRVLNAYYTRVAPHLAWIYEYIKTKGPKQPLPSDHIIAPPYVRPAPAYNPPPSSTHNPPPNSAYSLPPNAAYSSSNLPFVPTTSAPSHSHKKSSALSPKLSQAVAILVFATLFVSSFANIYFV